jgi:hypothetical protein
MTPGFLESNLDIAYPFVDSTEVISVGADPSDVLITSVVADALVVGDQDGPYVLEVFNPNYDPLLPDPLSLAMIRVSGASGVFIDTLSAVSSDLGGGFMSLDAMGTGGQIRMIVSTSGVVGLAALLAPVEFSARVCSRRLQGVTSIHGLTGDVVLRLEDYSTLKSLGDSVEVAFSDPEDRVDCSATPCDHAYSLGQAIADSQGSLHIEAGPCYRIVPSVDPLFPNRVVIKNTCDPCVKCEDLAVVQDKLEDQATYYQSLGAIYHNQFNRYQHAVAKANEKIAEVEGRGDISTATGPISIVERVVNRPYFTQLYLAVVNNSERKIRVQLTVTITPAGLAAQLVSQQSSWLVQHTLSGGDAFDAFTGFPGVASVDVEAQDSVGLNSEAKRMVIGSPTTGHWHLHAEIHFMHGAIVQELAGTVDKDLTPAIDLLSSPSVTP